MSVLSKSRERVRHPTFSVFAAYHGDITSDSMVATYSRRAEDSLHEPNYGTGTLTLTDKSGNYIENGRPVFRRGTKIKLFAGFDGDNVARFGGIIRDVSLDTDQNITLTLAEEGYKLRKSRTSGDYSSYETPVKLIDQLASLARIGEVIYENETGPPTTKEFGDTFLELRDYWAMIHGAALCIGYIQYFDPEGRLNLTRRTTFTDTGYIFTDSDIEYLIHKQVAELINYKAIDFVHCIRPEFTAGDGVYAGQHTRSRTDSVSKRKYGAHGDQETDELIGTWTNAGAIIDQTLDYFPYPREIYLLKMPAFPLLGIADRIFVRSEETGIAGYFIIIGVQERFSVTSYSGTYTLLSEGERF